MEKKKFDVFVIGSGIAGQTVAKACVEAGKKVAIADIREFGGTCANRGCDPKKVLIGATEALEQAHNLKGKGLRTKTTINWKQLQNFKQSFTDKIPAGTEKELKDLGIKLYHQSPKFLDEQTLSVEGKTVSAEKIIIATGLEPRPLSITGAKHLKVSDDFLDLKKLPKQIVFIGAGYIAMEFAHIAARAGAKVTVLDTGKRVLKAFDPDLVKELTKYSESLGIKFIFGAKPTALKKKRKRYKLTYEIKGSSKIIKSYAVFNTAGRVPAIKELELEKGNVDFNEKGVVTNGYLQSTSNTNVYACGDVSDKNLPLTPLSGRQGYVVSENILKGNSKELSVPVIPSVVFTLPNLATVGYSEKEARGRYKKIRVNYDVVPGWFNAKRINAPLYAYKVIMNDRTGEIVGAHLLGPNAGEIINLFALAINKGMTDKDIKSTIFTYPSWANDLKSMV
ncbi:dihydrolipoyl dehydrogenase family protein [Maribacter sp. MAR_2009_72]|uniref:dihydrolipoyl dehydrogenase family protein n=1 Tax=Maribacter sp. MAR_2009_72 TaxID=1250050 RepID=UPI001199CA98|nr:NAD(P)/FAD-dependent oxidoreductase [Maribacter sp. MAR_2009_72]TVZ16491.1 glutathione reductase (NADPH) [Maribacter sp. MAR_2009_72]